MKKALIVIAVFVSPYWVYWLGGGDWHRSSDLAGAGIFSIFFALMSAVF